MTNLEINLAFAIWNGVVACGFFLYARKTAKSFVDHASGLRGHASEIQSTAATAIANITAHSARLQSDAAQQTEARRCSNIADTGYKRCDHCKRLLNKYTEVDGVVKCTDPIACAKVVRG